MERFNPRNARRRYIAEGRSSDEVDALCALAAMIYTRPPEEIRAAVAKRRAEGKPEL